MDILLSSGVGRFRYVFEKLITGFILVLLLLIIRYSLNFSIYLLLIKILPPIKVSEMDRFSVLFFWFPFSVHLAFIAPVIMNSLKKYLK